MKVGLALSGGGARGFAHFGVLKALEELEIEVNVISGTSAGAIVASFYACGYSVEEAKAVVSKTNLFKLVWPAFSWRGLFSMNRSEEVFRKQFVKDNFSEARIPLHIVATNLNSGRPHVFTEGPLVKPMMASCCIPFVFAPVNINGQIYVDGGLTNNLPVESIRDMCDVLIGVNVSPVLQEGKIGGTKKMIERISMVSLSANVAQSSKQCDLLIEPGDLRSFGTFDIKMANQIFQIGYEATHAAFKRQNETLKQLLD